MYLTKYLIKHRLHPDATIFVNTLSGAMDVFSNDQLRDVQSLIESEQVHDTELAHYMQTRQYLFQSEEEEHRRFLALRETMRVAEREEPTVFVVSPTYSCFFKCSYCYEGDLTTQAHHSAISAADFLQGMESMEEFLRLHLQLVDKPYISFLGGEPLQPKTHGLVTSLLAEGARRDYRFTIITNGFLLNSFIGDLVRYAPSLKYIQITVDGPAAYHDRRRPLANSQGTFQRVTDNIGLALDSGLPVRMRTNLDLANMDGLVDLAKFVRCKGWDLRPNFKAYLAPVEDSTCRGLVVPREDKLLRLWLSLKEDPQFEELLSVFDDSKLFRATDMLEANISDSPRKVLPRFSYCAATKGKSFVFGPEGNIYQCLRGVGEMRTSIGTFWPTFQVDMEKINRWLQRDITRIDCKSCTSVATLQGGGCALESLTREGNMEACTCGSAREVVSGYLELRKDKLLHRAFGNDCRPAEGLLPGESNNS
jgi:uncharacterized protein